MANQTHGVPALISFFISCFGQLIKGQFIKAFFVVVCILLFGCLNSTPKVIEGKIAKTKPHLRDSTIVSGNCIVFLRPDSLRYNYYVEKDDGDLSAVDDDFGWNISTTMDSLSKNKRYKNIRGIISLNRYILINDCENYPIIIDRDTIDFGYILISRTKQMELHQDIAIDDRGLCNYFNIK